jgi:hypothetical protein
MFNDQLIELKTEQLALMRHYKLLLTHHSFDLWAPVSSPGPTTHLQSIAAVPHPCSDISWISPGKFGLAQMP